MMARTFNAVLRLDRWTRARFTPLGRMLLAALVGVGLFALNPRASLAYQLAIVLLCVPLASLLWAPWFRPRLRARRLLPRYATVGTPLRYTVELTSLAGHGLEDLQVRDELRRVAPGAAAADAVVDLGTGRRWLRPRVGYMRFMRAMRRLEGGRCLPTDVRGLPPGRTARVPMELVPLRRGYIHLDRVQVTHTDPLGVFRAARTVPLQDRVLVLPRRYRVSWSGAGGASHQTRSARTRSRSTGAGNDFARLREYRPRDPLRHIHWRAWARLGEPVVKEFHEERPSRNALVLDTFAAADCTRASFEEAVSVAASFVADQGWRSGRLDLLFAGNDTVHLTQGSEGEGVARMLEALAGAAPTDPGGFPALADAVTKRLGGFSACVLVLLDLDPPRRDLVHALTAARVTTLVLVVAPDAADRVRAGAALAGPALRLFPVDPGDGERVLSSLSGAAPSAPATPGRLAHA